RAAVHARDELGAAVGEFNAMVDELLETRQRLSAEAESRVTLEASLQRADKLVTVGQLSAGLAHEIGSPPQIVNRRSSTLAGRTAWWTSGAARRSPPACPPASPISSNSC